MSRSDPSSTAPTHGGASDRQSGQPGPGSGVSTAARYVRRAASSGAIAGLLGLLAVVRAGRELEHGSNVGAVRRGLMAVFWIGVAMTQWGSNRSAARERSRSSGSIDQRDVVDTSPDIGDVSSGSGSGSEGSTRGTPIEVTESEQASDSGDEEGAESDDTGERAGGSDPDEADEA